MIENDYDPAAYEAHLMKKKERFKIMLASFPAPEPEIFPSPSMYYRMRAEFCIWHDGDSLYHVMFDKKTREPVRTEPFPIASD